MGAERGVLRRCVTSLARVGSLRNRGPEKQSFSSCSLSVCESSGAQLAIGARGGANIKNLILDLRGVSFSIGHANARFCAICANHNSGQLKRLDRVASLF